VSGTPAVPPLVLASQSPRRAELLGLLGLEFETLPSDIDESWSGAEEPAAHALRLAREKALAAAAARPEALVIGSDTVVVLGGDVLGKPRDEEDAIAMLARLSGREHLVHTGLAVAEPGGRIESAVESVRVRLRAFGEAAARQYVATGEPLDKAGAYGIQGRGATLVESIAGDYYAVMGLPIARLITLLEALGWSYDFRGLRRGRGG
jgi:septum formation protein